MPIEIMYQGGSRAAAEISEAVGEILRDPNSKVELAREFGDAPDLPADAITVTDASSNLDPATGALIVTFAGPVFLDIWRRLILPHLERGLGQNSVGSEVKPSEKPKQA